jgi:hypothetical protein
MTKSIERYNLLRNYEPRTYNTHQPMTAVTKSNIFSEGKL